MLKILKEFAETFQTRIDNDFSFLTNIHIREGNRNFHVTVRDGRAEVTEGANPQAPVTLDTDEETLKKIYDGELYALTAGGKARASDVAPLEIIPAEGVDPPPHFRENLLTFLQRFFNRTSPEKILLGEEHARIVHGGHAIPLYYYPGFRSSWYMVKKGQRINEPGDTNPFPQAFVIIEGEGKAVIGEDTVAVRAGESYFIPPDSEHMFWTEGDSPMIMIWLAWGEQA
jgi:mannose-6-phosphate isomerase-like protein (cupin superfamily)